jgi:hypothetical protein
VTLVLEAVFGIVAGGLTVALLMVAARLRPKKATT